MNRARQSAPTHAHAAHATEYSHPSREVEPSPLGALLAKPLTAAPAEPSLFDGLLAGTLGSGKRRRLVICSQCGAENCSFSRYVDE